MLSDAADDTHPSSNMPDDSGRRPRPSVLPSRGQVLRVLTATQNSSALVFSVFLGVHLASPLSAALGGSTWADKTMVRRRMTRESDGTTQMTAREYYLPLEPLLVFAPLGVHLFSSTAKRMIITSQTKRPPPLTPHVITGWLLPIFLFPHITSHRLFPSASTRPISSLSPSELNFEFVGWGVNRWPWLSTLSYGGLVLTACWHAGVGMMKVVSWLRGPKPPSEAVEPATVPRRRISGKRKIGLRGLLGALLAVIAIGLGRVASESKHVSRGMERRYEAVYASLPWASLLR